MQQQEHQRQQQQQQQISLRRLDLIEANHTWNDNKRHW